MKKIQSVVCVCVCFLELPFHLLRKVMEALLPAASLLLFQVPKQSNLTKLNAKCNSILN